jgi:cell division septum initiation protein DivIVA
MRATSGDDLQKLEDQVEQLRAQLRRQRKAVRKLRTVDAARVRKLRDLRSEFRRMSHQLAALEARVADAAEATSPAPTAVEPSNDPVAREARGVLEAVRREHERIRVRFRTITSYEERLRRLEEATLGSPGPEAEPDGQQDAPEGARQ